MLRKNVTDICPRRVCKAAFSTWLVIPSTLISEDLNSAADHHIREESFMPSAAVLRFNENFDTMTFAEGFAFIERSRRQIDRLEHLPQKPGEIDRQELASVRQGLDDLEKRLRANPDCP